VGGLPETQHLVYLLLLEEGDERVDPEEATDAGEAILHLHGALIVAIAVKCWIRSGVIRATEDLSWQGRHVLFVYLFARDTISLCMCELIGGGPNPLFLLYMGGPCLAG
jgi:hypothetical protein